jgi:hypothetical protein
MPSEPGLHYSLFSARYFSFGFRIAHESSDPWPLDLIPSRVLAQGARLAKGNGPGAMHSRDMEEEQEHSGEIY